MSKQPPTTPTFNNEATKDRPVDRPVTLCDEPDIQPTTYAGATAILKAVNGAPLSQKEQEIVGALEI